MSETRYSNVAGHPLRHVSQVRLDEGRRKLRTAVEDGSVDLHDQEDLEAVADSVLATAFEGFIHKGSPAVTMVGEHVNGVKRAVKVLATFIQASDVRLPGWEESQVEVWFAHIVASDAQCKCDIDVDPYDGDVEMEWCDWYKDEANRRSWLIDWTGTTEEELQAKERAEAEETARRVAEQAARQREYERQELRRLAAKFNVDPRLLP